MGLTGLAVHIYFSLFIFSDYVCAPMPFIMGVDASYEPDELLLEGVVLVRLDSNEMKV